MRHVPGGVDEYLRLRAAPSEGVRTPAAAESAAAGASASGSELSGAERRAAQKELASIERRLEKATASVEATHARMATHDHTDYAGLQVLMEETRVFESEVEALEERWLELSELLG